jgi:hypothetical protein
MVYRAKRLSLILGLITWSFAVTARADFFIIAPNANATVPGDGRLDLAPFNDPSRFQQIFDASQFGPPTSTYLITQIAFRPDESQKTAFSHTLSNLRIDLSTTQVAVADLSPTFLNNVGVDDVTVFNGPVTLSSANQPGLGTTKAFDITIDLMTPFLYSPAAGNLLLDIRNFDPQFTGYLDGQSADPTSPVTSAVYRDGTTISSRGSVIPFGLVVQFQAQVQSQAQPQAVPEPGSFALLGGMGSLAAAGLAWRRRMAAGSLED